MEAQTDLVPTLLLQEEEITYLNQYFMFKLVIMVIRTLILMSHCLSSQSTLNNKTILLSIIICNLSNEHKIHKLIINLIQPKIRFKLRISLQLEINYTVNQLLPEWIISNLEKLLQLINLAKMVWLPLQRFQIHNLRCLWGII